VSAAALASALPCDSAKEPCISEKGPYISAIEPYISAWAMHITGECCGAGVGVTEKMQVVPLTHLCV